MTQLELFPESVDDYSNDGLPDGWIQTKLSEVVMVSSGQTPKKIESVSGSGEIPWYRVSDMNTIGNEYSLSTSQVYVSADEANQLGLKIQPPGTIVFPKRGGAIATNKRRILSKFSAYDLNVMGITSKGIDEKYLWHWFLTIDLGSLSDGSNVPQINNDDILNLSIAIAPLNEQQRIVEAIESLFTQLDAGVGALKRLRANLRRYKAAVLKAACEGKLVPQDSDDEPASDLLERILGERRAKWEAEQRAKGKDPRKLKYDEPAAPDTSDLPELPEGWVWASVEQIGFVQLGRQRSPKNRSKDYPTKYIRAANITEKGLDLSDVLDMEFTPQERVIYRLRRGDILLSEASGSPDQVGKPVVWNDELEECCFQNTVIRLRPFRFDSLYPLTVFRNYYVNGVFAQVAAGVGINHLSAGKFSKLPVPVAPENEQTRIAAEVETRLSILDALEYQLVRSVRRAERLRQAILKQAFEGKLVPQDANDEPASVLLERIKQGRSNQSRKQTR